jgi:hypothetical protein
MNKSVFLLNNLHFKFKIPLVRDPSLALVMTVFIWAICATAFYTAFNTAFYTAFNTLHNPGPGCG